MKIGRIKTIWKVVILSYYTALVSFRALIRSLGAGLDRPWVDKNIHHWADQLLDELRVTYTVHNPHQIKPEPGKATILMCNHSSLYDIPLAFKAFPEDSIRMLAKKELSKIPLMGKAMKQGEFPFIDRKNRNQAIKDLDYAKKLMESGIVIWIAPEGTRSKDGALGGFKKGGFITAIQSGATIIPIGIRGANDIIPARTYSINLDQKAEIHIGAPIDASEYSLDEKERLIEKTREAIQTLVEGK